MMQFLSKMIDRALVVAGALFFMQLPLFMHQYQHQLIGRVAELHWQVEHMQIAATNSGKNLDQYIQKFLKNSDEEIATQGKLMNATQLRLQKFTKLLSQLQHASPLMRPLYFLLSLQGDMVISTFHAFKPGISFTMESALYAFVGMVVGWILFLLLRKFTKLLSDSSQFFFHTR